MTVGVNQTADLIVWCSVNGILQDVVVDSPKAVKRIRGIPAPGFIDEVVVICLPM